MSKGIPSAFSDAGLPLCKTLTDMLNDHISHCTERRGCGYTQATRFLAAAINQPRDNVAADELNLFADWPIHQTQDLAGMLTRSGWQRGWRGLHEAPAASLAGIPPSKLLNRLQHLVAIVRSIRARLVLEENRLFMGMLEDLLTGEGQSAPDIAGMPEKPEIGSCSQAEEFFLEIAHSRIRRGGKVNIIVDRGGGPVMVEKMNLGESHSAMLVAPVRMHGVWLPPGGLCALRFRGDPAPLRPTRHGAVLSLDMLEQTRFLRLTTLAVPPQSRQRAFHVQVEAQLRANMLSPTVTTIAQLRQFALNELAGSG